MIVHDDVKKVMEIIFSADSANDIAQLVSIEDLVVKRRKALEKQFSVKSSRGGFFG